MQHRGFLGNGAQDFGSLRFTPRTGLRRALGGAKHGRMCAALTKLTYYAATSSADI